MWQQDLGTLVLLVMGDMQAGQAYVFSFTLTAYSIATSLLSVSATGSATIGPQPLRNASQAPSPVPDSTTAGQGAVSQAGNDSAWRLKQIQQSSPYPNAPNDITINVSTFADLSGAGACAITVVGLAGTQTPSTPALQLTYPDWASASEAIFGQSGQWDSSGVLSLRVAPGLTLRAGRSYAVTFQVLNPGGARGAAAAVSVGASGSPQLGFARMEGGAGLRAPLAVLDPGFAVRRLGQSTPWPGAQNTITCTLAAAGPLQSGAVLLLMGLVGSATGDTTALVISTATLPGTQGPALSGTATWRQAAGALAVQVARNTAIGEEVVFAFQLTNPGVGQSPPAPILAAAWPSGGGPAPSDAMAAGPWAVPPQAVDADGGAPASVPGAAPGDASPLRVYSPGFPVASVSQAGPGAGGLITVTLVPNCNIAAAAGSRITVAGLVGSATPDGEALYLAGGFDGDSFYSDVHVSADGRSWARLSASAGWTPREGHALVSLRQSQTLVVIAGRTVDAQFKRAYLNDVWASPDGAAWSIAAAAAPFPPRAFFGAAALDGGALLVYGGLADRPALRLNDVWRSGDGGQTWTQVLAGAPWAPRYGLAALAFPMPAPPPAGGVHSLYTDSAALPAVLAAAGSACSPGCGRYDNGLPGCAVIAGPAPQCCVRTDPCAVRSNLADLWTSADAGATWMAAAPAPAYAARTFPAAAALPDGTVAMAAGYDFYDRFTADLQALSAGGGPAAAAQSAAVPVGPAGAAALRRANGQLAVFRGCLWLIGGHSRTGASQYTYYGDVWATG